MSVPEPPRDTAADRGPVPPDRVVAPRSSAPPVKLHPEHLYKAVALLFLFAVLYRFFADISQVLLLAYASAILAVALNVIVQLIPLQRRWVSAVLGLLLLVGIVGLLWFGAPALIRQLRGLVGRIPEFQQQLAQWGEWLRQQTGLNIDLVSERTRGYLQQAFSNLQGGDVLGRARGLLEVLFLPLIVLFGGLFAVAKPNDQLLSPLFRAVPRDRRLAFRRMFELLGLRLRGWIRGVLLAMLAVGVLSTLAFSLLQVRYALLLGILNGILEFIPLVGPWIGGALAVLVTFLDDPQKALWVALVVLAIQQIESNLITPLVMSSAAEVHPFVTLFALLLFSYLFGFLGLLLAVPLVLLLWTVLEVLWVERAIDTDEDRIEPVVRE